MNSRTLFSGAALAAIVALTASHSLSGPLQNDSESKMQVDEAAMSAAFQPGPQHRRLLRSAGEWDLAVTVYFGGPDDPAMTSSGTSSIKSVLGGKFIQENMNWTMRMPDGQGGVLETAISGLGLYGYDNFRKLYVGSWADSVNSHLLKFSGTDVPNRDAITYYGEMDEPGLGIIGRTVKYIVSTHDEDHFTMEIFDLAVSDDYKVVEIRYSRRK